MNKVEKIWTKAGAVATAAAITMAPGLALAQTGTGTGTGTGLGSVFDSIRTNIKSIPDIIAYVAYIAGAGFGISGIMALRQHVDNPAQAPLKNALVRLTAAAALVAFPWLLNTMLGTLGGTQQSNISVPTIGTK